MPTGRICSGFDGYCLRIPEDRGGKNEDQKHISLFVHGYNNGWEDSVKRYMTLKSKLYSGPGSLGALVLFSWPSNDAVYGYLPDREDARASGPELAKMLVSLHNVLLTNQHLALKDKAKPCKAKISIIAHSMGNYVIQKALAIASRQLNNPQLITLVHQLVMVAADVDNDIFQKHQPAESDGSLMANLCYRITALYTGKDQVLGASAGLKHFGTRRLGRSGLAGRADVYDNVCDIDISDIITGEKDTHSEALDEEEPLALIRDILRGVDRSLLNQ